MSECTSNFREVEFNKSNQRVSYECCNKNGCNWNRETAQKNLNYSHIWKQHAVSCYTPTRTARISGLKS